MNNNVLILDFGNTGNEVEAIRQCLEYFGYDVFKYSIGRPNDFIKILSDKYAIDYKYLIISCHGIDEKIIMPKLGEEIYTENEPKQDFTSEDIKKYIKLKNKIIINTGCSTGASIEVKNAFVNDSNYYISPNGYPEASSALIFIINLFYQLKNNSLDNSFENSKNIDEETSIFEISKNNSK